MNQFIKSMGKLLISLRNHPEKDNEIAELIKSTLNNTFTNIECKRVFISKGSESDPYAITVIPNLPTGNILDYKNILKYDIDIDIDSFINSHNYNGLTEDELIAWMLHELFANVVTNETLLRFQKLIIKYYDVNNASVLNTIRVFGKLLWIGIFSRTAKSYIDNDNISNNSHINMMIMETGLSDAWNTALAKYVCNYGGSTNILSDDYLNRQDKTQLREFNELARKYSAYVLKYNNTDYSTMIKYIISSTNSELVKYYTQKEPEQLVAFKETDVYNLFDDRKLILEDAELIEDPSIEKIKSYAKLQTEYDDILIDIRNVETESDKLNIAIRLKNLMNKISEELTKNDNAYNLDSLSELKEKAMSLSDKLDNIKTDKVLSVVEIDDTANI